MTEHKKNATPILEELVKHYNINTEGLTWEEAVQRRYTTLVQDRNTIEIASLRRQTGITPAEDTVQQMYAEMLPKLVDDLYKEGHSTHHNLKIISERTGITPADELVQKEYTTLVQEGALLTIRRLYEYTGVTPNIPEDLAQKKYAEFIQEGYLSSIQDLYELTGITANIPEDVVQKEYARSIQKKGYEGSIEELREKLPRGLTEDVVQKEYARLTQNNPDFPQITILREATGIKPTEDTVQKAYTTLITSGQIDHVASLREATGVTINVSEDLVQQQYTECMKNGWTDDLVNLHELTRVMLNEQNARDYVAEIMGLQQ